MKVKATVILASNQICRLHDRLPLLTYSAWHESESGYCTQSLRISDDGSFAAHGQSCCNNYCSIEFDAATSTLRIEIDSRRHALWETGNCAGEVFSLLRMGLQPHPSGEGWHNPPDLGILSMFKVKEYDSWRKDKPFWECDLTATPALDRQRTVLNDYFRQWKPEVWRDHFMAYDPSRKAIIFHTSEEGVGYGKTATSFLDGTDYRRLSAEGIRL
jgi:hypothetical protein